MIVHYQMPAVQEQLAQGFPAMVEATEGYLAQMLAICENLEPADLAGTSKEDVVAAMNNYIAAVRNSTGTGIRSSKIIFSR